MCFRSVSIDCQDKVGNIIHTLQKIQVRLQSFQQQSKYLTQPVTVIPQKDIQKIRQGTELEVMLLGIRDYFKEMPMSVLAWEQLSKKNSIQHSYLSRVGNARYWGIEGIGFFFINPPQPEKLKLYKEGEMQAIDYTAYGEK